MDLSEWRARIDEVDEELVDLINRRLEYAVEIGRIKRAEGLEVRDPQRERDLLQRLREYNQGPLGDSALVDIFTRIIAEARDLEQQ
ncbi:MAG: chorismate mutase [Gemmatimonadetes bacterium]|nr:chorismate mutase [Gemmatimonadota bacterium]